jgi:hypothetical protein
LFKTARIRSAVRNHKSNKDGASVERLLIEELSASILEPADRGLACIYALEGKSDEAVKWLRETADKGFPCHPLFERDAYLSRIRQAPEFIKFMSEMKTQNEMYRREFGGGATPMIGNVISRYQILSKKESKPSAVMFIGVLLVSTIDYLRTSPAGGVSLGRLAVCRATICQ